MNRPELFAALVFADKGKGAGPEVEKALLKAFQRRRIRSMWLRSSGWAAIAAAVALVWITARRPAEPVRPADVPVAPPIVAELPAPILPVPVLAGHTARPQPARASTPREVATGFIPLMLEPDPPERGRLVRVKLPRSALTVFGLPVNEERSDERIQADVLIGEDGLARAIRFVR